jgi:hypothetical protein
MGPKFILCGVVQGLSVWCRPPCTDEPRIALVAGDLVRVTRWKKHWLYGEKILPANVKTVSLRNGKRFWV